MVVSLPETTTTLSLTLKSSESLKSLLLLGEDILDVVLKVRWVVGV